MREAYTPPSSLITLNLPVLSNAIKGKNKTSASHRFYDFEIVIM